ncbi:cupredoxin domain-containing protein, partial [Staphylococcus epidermidis]
FLSKKLNYSKTKDQHPTQPHTLLLNPILNPKLTPKQHKIPFTLLNPSNPPHLNLNLTNNQTFQYIPSHPPQLKNPKKLKQINLPPSQTKEILIHLSKIKRHKITLLHNHKTLILPITNKHKTSNKGNTPKVSK